MYAGRLFGHPDSCHRPGQVDDTSHALTHAFPGRHDTPFDELAQAGELQRSIA